MGSLVSILALNDVVLQYFKILLQSNVTIYDHVTRRIFSFNLLNLKSF